MGLRADDARVLRDLVERQRVAALGTLHAGSPSVSMVPFALTAAKDAFVIHVSDFAAHTKDMLASPIVSLMLVGTLDAEASALSLPRATFQCRADPCGSAAALHASAKSAYVERFPESAELFGFADFRLFLLRPESIRLVAGFARAVSAPPEALVAALAG